MIFFYIIIFITITIFILHKIPVKAPKVVKQNAICKETEERNAAIELKFTEPPEIIYGINPLKNERIQRMKIGMYQTALVQQKLLIPNYTENFFTVTELNGYQIGVTVGLLLDFLPQRVKTHRNISRIYGDKIIMDCINNGLRKLDYKYLEAEGNKKFNKKYKKKHNIPIKENAFSIHLFRFSEIKYFLREGYLVVKNIKTNSFEPVLSFCETKENIGPFAGGDFFQMFIGDTLIYRAQTLYY